MKSEWGVSKIPNILAINPKGTSSSKILKKFRETEYLTTRIEYELQRGVKTEKNWRKNGESKEKEEKIRGYSMQMMWKQPQRKRKP